MKDVINNFVNAKIQLKKYFKYEEENFIKVLNKENWTIKEGEGIYFLKYWNENEDIKECVIVKKDGEPLILRGKDYTMVIGIECVKIGFVLKNSNNCK